MSDNVVLRTVEDVGSAVADMAVGLGVGMVASSRVADRVDKVHSGAVVN